MRICFLDKAKADEILPALFRILYDNMEPIAPTGDSYETGLAHWLDCVKPALSREPRQILLLMDGDEIAGYFQYYVSGGVFMMEEIQFREEYKGTGLFASLYRHLVGIIPADTEFVEAYAHKNNAKSMAVLDHLGLSIIGENKNGNSWHYRGRYETIARRYSRDHLTE
ncbi:MAG: hypothetical protein IJ497_12850 [Clostridia bacterium]|nr:hypothetical protein [Clostridia bacterium]